MVQSYELQIISVSGIHWKPDPLSLHRDTPNLYVEIDVDGKRVHRSSAKRDWGGMWNDISSLSLESPSSRIVLQVFYKRSLKKDKCLATAEMEIGLLLEKCNTEKGRRYFHLALDHVGKDSTEISKPELVVRLTTIGRIQAGAITLTSATQDSAALESGVARPVVGLVERSAEHGDLASALGTLVARLDIIVHIGAEMAKIHPYSNAAWKVLTSVYEAVKKQQKTDEKIVQLVQTMADVYSFAEDIKSLSEKMKCLEDTVAALVKQTAECSLFIREYTGHGFCARLLTEIWSEQTEKIDDFTATFIKLQESFDKGLTLRTLMIRT